MRVPLKEGVPLGVPVEETEAVALLVSDTLAVLLAEAFSVSEAVGEGDSVVLEETVVLGVALSCPLGSSREWVMRGVARLYLAVPAPRAPPGQLYCLRHLCRYPRLAAVKC